MSAHLHDDDEGRKLTVDGVELTEGMKKLEAAGADVVGLNCGNGPETMLSYMEVIKKSGVKVIIYLKNYLRRKITNLFESTAQNR